MVKKVSKEKIGELVEKIRRWKGDPAEFVKDVWGLSPQPLKEGYVVGINTNLRDIRAEWFKEFKFNEQATWQQWVILLAVKRGLSGNKGKRFISVSSGRGIGKSTVMAWLLLWFLICHKNSNIPCTAPTAQQMYDVLWKEVSKWHRRMPEWLRELIVVESTYIRVKESPKAWWARAGTARKENPEALSGVHSDDVMLLIDEASAVADEVIKTGIESLTGERSLVLMISNYTRLTGYFHESQQNLYNEYEVLSFSGEDSPIVDRKFIERQKRRGVDSNDYRVSVSGKAPKGDEEVDGYINLVSQGDMRYITGVGGMSKGVVLGVDPSGSGADKTALVIRDRFRARCLGAFSKLKPMQIVNLIIGIMDEYKIRGEDVIIDTFGIGADLLLEFNKLGYRVNGVLVGRDADDSVRYMNKRAELTWRMRDWIIGGGELIGTSEGWDEILNLKYINNNGRIQIMSKERMKKLGIPSPNIADALMLTFMREVYDNSIEEEGSKVIDFDAYSGI